MEKYAEEKIERGCRNLYEKYRDKDIDIFNLEREISIRYPKEDIKNILDDINYI